MNILVTGHCGFIGSHIYNALIRAGHTVTGIDDLSGTKDTSNIIDGGQSWISDLCDAEKTYKIIRQCKPQVLYHLAASAREIGSLFEPLHSTHSNLLAYMTVLNYAIKHGTLEKVVLFSTMATYGDQGAPFNENMERKPEDVYGANKTAMEHCTEILADVHDFRYTIIRPHNVYGEHQSLSDRFRNVFGIWMNRIMHGDSITVFGDGKQRRSPSYIMDSLPCYLQTMNNKTTDGQIINIGGKKNYSIRQLAGFVRIAMCACGWKDTGIEHLPPRPREVFHAWTTFERSERLLGFKENYQITEGIKNMAQWATDKGPQEWTEDKMELISPQMPEIWK